MEGRHPLFANENEGSVDSIRALTKACVSNNAIQVKEILKAKPDLSSVSGPIFDGSKRYPSVTVFQYALHTGKATIADAIIMSASNARRDDLLSGLKSQLEDYLKQGVTFTENRQNYTVIPDADHALHSRLGMLDVLLKDMNKPSLSPGK